MKKMIRLLIAVVCTSCISAQPQVETSFPLAARAGATPCLRTVASDLSLKSISGAFDGVFASSEYGGGPNLHDGPLQVEYITINFEVESLEAFHNAFGTSIDYVFRGTVTTDDKKNLGSAKVDLVDMARGIVVRSQEGSFPIVGDQKIEAGNAIREIAKAFMPLDEVLYNYEKIPLSCEIELPGDEVGSGEKVTISIEKLRFQGELPKPWQFLAVKVEEGKILNGEKLGDYHYFQVGQSGYIQVEYEAPEECEDKKETMTIYNTCIFLWEGDRRSGSGFTNDEIGSKEFPIVCYDGEFFSEYDVVGLVDNTSGHYTARTRFRHAEKDKIKGHGPAVGSLQLNNPRYQAGFNMTLTYDMEGIITNGEGGIKILTCTSNPVYGFMDEKMDYYRKFEVYQTTKFFFRDKKIKIRQNIKDNRGSWGLLEFTLDVNNNTISDAFGRFHMVNDEGEASDSKCTYAMRGPGIVEATCCDGDGDCHSFISPINITQILMAQQNTFSIEWKNGAEKPIEYSSPEMRITGKTKLILYKKK